MAKHLYRLRFKPDSYVAFKKLAKTNGYTVTGAFEQFMSCCVEANMMVFPDRGVLDFETEARVLVDWLSKGQLFYRAEAGIEVNIRGRLLGYCPECMMLF